MRIARPVSAPLSGLTDRRYASFSDLARDIARASHAADVTAAGNLKRSRHLARREA